MYPRTIARQACLKKNGLSAANAARLFGFDRQTHRNLLNGRSGISPEKVIQLEKVFDTLAREWQTRQFGRELAEEIEDEPFHSPTYERRGKA